VVLRGKEISKHFTRRWREHGRFFKEKDE